MIAMDKTREITPYLLPNIQLTMINSQEKETVYDV